MNVSLRALQSLSVLAALAAAGAASAAPGEAEVRGAAGAGAGAGTGTGAGTGAEAGAPAGAGTGTGADAGARAGTGADARADAGAKADDGAGARAEAEVRGEVPLGAAITGPLLTPALVEEPQSYLRLAIGAERFGNGFAGNDFLLVVSAILRHRAFGPNATLSAKPRLGTSGFEESRWLFGLGLRGYIPLLGTEIAYGIGLQGELRFEEHFWLLHATPIELSGVIYRKRTFEIELSVGMRVAMAGELIDSFLIDPNGYHNEDAAQRLARAKHEEAARGFIRLVFSRRLD